MSTAVKTCQHCGGAILTGITSWGGPICQCGYTKHDIVYRAYPEKEVEALRVELTNEQEKIRKLELENSMSNCETVAWYEGHDVAVAGCCKRWKEALTLPIPASGVMNDPLESLYRATEALRSEVANLKEDNEQAYISLAIEGVRPNSLRDGIDTLTQQLAAMTECAKNHDEARTKAVLSLAEYKRQLLEALERIEYLKYYGEDA